MHAITRMIERVRSIQPPRLMHLRLMHQQEHQVGHQAHQNTPAKRPLG